MYNLSFITISFNTKLVNTRIKNTFCFILQGGELNSVRENTTCTKEIDIVLLIDSSGSVREKWNDIIDAAQTLQADFEIDDNATRVGIIDIGVVANVYKHLDSNNTNEETFQLLEQLRQKHQNGNITLEDGIFMAVKLLSAATPLRSDAKKVILLYTDAEFTPGEDQRIMVQSNFYIPL